MLYGYGGFGISMEPGLHRGSAGLGGERRGLGVAQLRGGGEEGEAWHRAGMREAKQNVFADFEAAARHLRSSGRASRSAISADPTAACWSVPPSRASPALYDAVVCSAPLLDMVRYERFGLGIDLERRVRHRCRPGRARLAARLLAAARGPRAASRIHPSCSRSSTPTPASTRCTPASSPPPCSGRRDDSARAGAAAPRGRRRSRRPLDRPDGRPERRHAELPRRAPGLLAGRAGRRDDTRAGATDGVVLRRGRRRADLSPPGRRLLRRGPRAIRCCCRSTRRRSSTTAAGAAHALPDPVLGRADRPTASSAAIRGYACATPRSPSDPPSATRGSPGCAPRSTVSSCPRSRPTRLWAYLHGAAFAMQNTP